MKYYDLLVFDKLIGLQIDERHDIDFDIMISSDSISFKEYSVQKKCWINDSIDLKNHIVKIIHNQCREVEDIERRIY